MVEEPEDENDAAADVPLFTLTPEEIEEVEEVEEIEETEEIELQSSLQYCTVLDIT